MSDQNKIAQMLEHLVNDDQEKAEELFHEYVVERSREIYENLIENELDLDEVSNEETDDLLSDVEDEDDVKEAEEDEMDMEMDMDSGEEGEEGESEEGEEGEEGDDDEPATKGDINNLSDAIKELEDELARMMDADMGGDEPMKDAFDTEVEELEVEDLDSFETVNDLETVREYVEKVAGGHGAEKKGAGEAAGANTKSTVAGKNDMGGTTANIAKGGEGNDKGTAGGLLNPSTKEDAAGNVNVPGSKNATKLNSVAKGHGAEKAGAKEDGGVNKTSLFRK